MSLLWRLRLILCVAFLDTMVMLRLDSMVAQLPNTYSAAISRIMITNAPISRPVYPSLTYCVSTSMRFPAILGANARAKLPATITATATMTSHLSL